MVSTLSLQMLTIITIFQFHSLLYELPAIEGTKLKRPQRVNLGNMNFALFRFNSVIAFNKFLSLRIKCIFCISMMCGKWLQ
jgi:hypothetical protein